MGATPSFRHSGWKSHKKCILLQIAKIAFLLSYLNKVSIFVSAWLDGAQIKNISENYCESEFFSYKSNRLCSILLKMRLFLVILLSCCNSSAAPPPCARMLKGPPDTVMEDGLAWFTIRKGLAERKLCSVLIPLLNYELHNCIFRNSIPVIYNFFGIGNWRCCQSKGQRL